MKVTGLSFGSITVDGKTYDRDIIVDGGEVKKRKKSGSKKYREMYGHTPLSADENIPWDCRRLVVGAGHSSEMPVMDEVREMAKRKNVELLVLDTPEALKHINDPHTNLIVHLTC